MGSISSAETKAKQLEQRQERSADALELYAKALVLNSKRLLNGTYGYPLINRSK